MPKNNEAPYRDSAAISSRPALQRSTLPTAQPGRLCSAQHPSQAVVFFQYPQIASRLPTCQVQQYQQGGHLSVFQILDCGGRDASTPGESG